MNKSLEKSVAAAFESELSLKPPSLIFAPLLVQLKTKELLKLPNSICYLHLRYQVDLLHQRQHHFA